MTALFAHRRRHWFARNGDRRKDQSRNNRDPEHHDNQDPNHKDPKLQLYHKPEDCQGSPWVQKRGMALCYRAGPFENRAPRSETRAPVCHYCHYACH